MGRNFQLRALNEDYKVALGLSIPFDSKNKEYIDFNEQVKFAQQAERLGFTSLKPS
jgi:hypothetical protein